jgi:hypothetical protein
MALARSLIEALHPAANLGLIHTHETPKTLPSSAYVNCRI